MSKDLLSDALALPAEERARLAHELIRSLDDTADAGAAEAWVREIERRAREVQSDLAELLDWDEVRERLRRRWRKR